MSCLCQYIISCSPPFNGIELLASVALPGAEADTVNAIPAATDAENFDSCKDAVTDDKKISVCISELAAYRAENWLLKKKLHEYEVTIRNLEQLMTTIVNKQHQVLNDMFAVRQRNHDLQAECMLQRDFHSVEREALMKELHEMKIRSQFHVMDVAEDEETRTVGSREFEKELTATDSEEECSYDLESEEDEQSVVSSAESTMMSSVDSSQYSTESETYDSEESEEDGQDDNSEAETESE